MADIYGCMFMKKNYTSWLFRFYGLMLLLLCGIDADAKQLRVLFIGNSYTYVNDLPNLINNLAVSTGDQLIYQSNTIGGYTLQQHSANATTLALIAQGNWDFVVLQEQSQLPSFPDAQVETDVYPYARKLDSLVKVSNPCAKTVFYMTWGRKNGDNMNCPVFPPVCTYAGMDDLLQLRYTNMADSNNAVISPVAKVWRYLRSNNPAIELYDADESHPSLKGSYAAACAFYSVLYKKDPVGCSYDAGIGSDAVAIKNAAKKIAYDSLGKWYQYYPPLHAAFSFSTVGNQVSFNNTSATTGDYIWYFGDGDSSTGYHPVHRYAQNGNYTVKLVVKHCQDTVSVTKTVQMKTVGIAVDVAIQSELIVYPNPAGRELAVLSGYAIKHIAITDMLGRAVYKANAIDAMRYTVPLDKLPAGQYYLHVSTEKGMERRVFIKE